MRTKKTAKFAAAVAVGAALVMTTPGASHAADTGPFYLKNAHSNKCLEIENSSKVNGANAQQWSCVGQSGAKWKLRSLGNGEYLFINVGSGKCLEVENGWRHVGAPIQQWTCNANLGHHKWKIREWTGSGGDFWLSNVGTGYLAEVENSWTHDGAPVQQWSGAMFPSDAPGQLWYLISP
ncbi:RICIN domain-containing protein [Streptomyces sp. SBC-4]|nr:RICIN domain-containing protein [Streptomyces sp. SBC-4]MDV5145257.1 RICIN domain-containing protein [Streptomyces sp. SBC-4]